MGTNNQNSPAERLCGLIGLAARGRMLSLGAGLATQSVRQGKAYLALVSSDASKNTVKRVFNCCEYYGCDCGDIPVDSASLGSAVGRTGLISAISVNDVHMAKGIRKILDGLSSTEEGRVTEHVGN